MTISIGTIIEDVIDEMTPYLNKEQLEHLTNALYIHLHGVKIVEECTDLVANGVDSDEAKIRMFVASKRAVNRSAETMKGYVKEIHSVLDYLHKPIDEITGMDLRYYYSVMREKKHLKMSSIQTKLHYLNSFWEFLLGEGLVSSNPVKKVGSLRVEKEIKKPYTQEEIEKIRLGCTNPRDRAIVEFLYSTGVRVSELVSLNVRDINFSKQELIVFGKESKERKTYLTDTATFYLERYLQTRADEPDLLDRPLFVTNDAPHNRLSVCGVQFMLRKVGKRAGVDKVHPHRFRRTIATDLLNRGMPLEQVKEFLGHEKLDTTMIYCTISEESVRSSHKKYA